MKSIAIIPARSGSKGLKDKNIKLLNGKPMLAYTIETALASGKYDCVHVSTDSEIYAEIAREYGADVAFLRSAELSTDIAGSWDVVKWTLKEYERLGKNFEIVALLQPTSPLRSIEDIRESFSIMEKKDAQAVVGVCEMEHSPLWSNTLPENGCMNGFIRKEANAARQKLSSYYRINGAMYMVKTSLLMQEPMELYGSHTYAYIMPKERSIDIDDELDFIIAEKVMASLLVK